MNETGADLRREYMLALEGDPGNPALTYLLATLTPQASEAERLLNEALRIDPNIRDARLALSRHYLCQGRFNQAYDLLKDVPPAESETLEFRGVALIEGKDYEFDELYTEACVASGNYQPLIDRARADMAQKEFYFYQATMTTRLLAFTGQQEETSDFITKALDYLTENFTYMDRDQYEKMLNAHRLLGEGKVDEAIRLLSGDEDMKYDFYFMMELGDYDTAFDLARNYELDQPTDRLLLYAALEANGLEVQAKDSLRLAMNDLGYFGGKEYEKVVEMFKQTEPPNLDQVRDLLIMPADKKVIYLAIGMKYPQIRQQAFEQAHYFNYDRSWGHYLIERIIAGNKR